MADEIKSGKGRASVGSGGPWKIAHSSTEPGDDYPHHIIWLPKGYGPCEGQFVVALVATPFDNNELDKQLAQAVARTIEEFMRSANRRNRQIKERGWRLPATSNAGRSTAMPCGDQGCNQNREAKMITVASGVWCDPCIAPLVTALNAAGIETQWSCCGHGRLPTVIGLRDGRQLVICDTLDDAKLALGAIAPGCTISDGIRRVRDCPKIHNRINTAESPAP